MTQLEADPQKGHDLDRRTVRALTQYMTVLPEGGDVFTVVSQSGNSYTVDLRENRCSCPDKQHNLSDGDRCKHLRRVAFATGETPIPSVDNPSKIDPQLGEHTDSTPKVAATDGGVTATETAETDDARPDDCDCAPCMGDLPCWPCYRDGFDSPAGGVADD